MNKSSREQRRETILDAAESLFAQHEYAEVRLEDVARRASVAKGTLYLYFESKLDLFLSTVERKLQRMVELLLTVLNESPDPLTAIHRFIRAELAFVQEHSEFLRAYYPQVLNMRLRAGPAAAEVKRRVVPIMETLVEAFASRIREGQEQGLFRAVNPRQAACLLGAWLREVAILSISGEELIGEPEIIESFFLEGLLVRHDKGKVVE